VLADHGISEKEDRSGKLFDKILMACLFEVGLVDKSKPQVCKKK